ncbi:hypothetical protein MHBO_000607 [Bonamia ostreae]|uniref:INO80 complex subunit B-like conserved region domain-containing protein n=1 Tax=Bonamia ostreae TaxID=126728 RepID=A0ABV2AGU0_9EUKA
MANGEYLFEQHCYCKNIVFKKPKTVLATRKSNRSFKRQVVEDLSDEDQLFEEKSSGYYSKHGLYQGDDMDDEERERKRKLIRKRKREQLKMEAISNLLENSQLQIKRREREKKLAEKRSKEALITKDKMVGKTVRYVNKTVLVNGIKTISRSLSYPINK